MNTPTSKNFYNKRRYRILLVLITFFLLCSYAMLSYFIFLFFKMPLAFTVFCTATLIYTVFFGWLRRITYIRYCNNSIIVKGIFNKTLLTPLKAVEIEPMIHLSRLTVLRVNFASDGIHYSYFTFMNNTGFQRIKKRQAISRVL